MKDLKRVLTTAYLISISLNRHPVLMLWKEQYLGHSLIGIPLAQGSPKILRQSCRAIGSLSFFNKANL